MDFKIVAYSHSGTQQGDMGEPSTTTYNMAGSQRHKTWSERSQTRKCTPQWCYWWNHPNWSFTLLELRQVTLQVSKGVPEHPEHRNVLFFDLEAWFLKVWRVKTHQLSVIFCVPSYRDKVHKGHHLFHLFRKFLHPFCAPSTTTEVTCAPLSGGWHHW